MHTKITKVQYLIETVKANINSDACIIWPFCKLPTGYGKVGYNRKVVYTHDLAYSLFVESEHHELLNQCLNRACFHPRHWIPRDYATLRAYIIEAIGQVFTDDRCLEWPFARSSGGYGHIRENGEDIRVSRIVVELTTGKPVPVGLDACHACDNPPCFRPSHLFPGTRVDNMQDCKRKGRLRNGATMRPVQTVS